jgi:DNA-binding response OmpR family regulator
MKILIAEDEPVSRTLLQTTLTKWGHEVIACTDGVHAWDVLKEEGAPNLVILDWMMPNMDGIEVCRRIREESSETLVYVILLTTNSQKQDIITGLKAGADDYITKPWEPDELQARIQVGMRVIELQEHLVESERLRALAQTAGAAAHEINQPLIVIMGNAELLMMIMDEDDPHRKQMETFRKAGKRISEIVNKMASIQQYVTKPYVKGKDIVDFDASVVPRDEGGHAPEQES